MSFVTLVYATVSIMLNALAQLCLRKLMLTAGEVGITDLLAAPWKLLGRLWLWSGLSCFGLSLLLWLVVLSRLEISQAYPLNALGFCFTALLGYLFLQEDLNLVRMAGIGIIVLGIVVISKS